MTLQDVTVEHKSELMLAKSNLLLEQRVAERTSELERINLDLDKARENAEQANASKTNFLAGASHDLMQPLHAARLYISLLKQNNKIAKEPEHSLEIVSNIDSSLDSAEKLLNSLLEISKLESNRTHPIISTFPVSEIFDRLNAQFSSICSSKQLDFRIRYTDSYIRSDKKLLFRVLQNFVSNAIRYTDSGGVLIGFRQRGEMHHLIVYDTGIGIDKSQSKLIFDEFYRLDPAKQMDDRGLGLGLSISKRLASILDHKLGLRSTPGRGSCFWIEVPIADPENQIKKSDSYNVTLSNYEHRLEITCLCLDNDSQINASMTQLLESWGCRVFSANTVDSAIEKYKKNKKIDIVLADYHLDGNLTGMDLILHLRQQYNEDLPAILITADHTSEVEVLAKRSNVKLILKPLEVNHLRRVLQLTFNSQHISKKSNSSATP